IQHGVVPITVAEKTMRLIGCVSVVSNDKTCIVNPICMDCRCARNAQGNKGAIPVSQERTTNLVYSVIADDLPILIDSVSCRCISAWKIKKHVSAAGSPDEAVGFGVEIGLAHHLSRVVDATSIGVG